MIEHLKPEGAERRRVVLSAPLCWLARQTCHWPKTQQPLFNVQLQIRTMVTIWRACTHSTYCYAHFRPVLVYVLSVQHLLANESLIKATVLQHYSPVSLTSRIERIQLARSMNHKSATLAEKKNKFRSACWLKTKRFLARATQKGQKTRQNNFSWKSVRLSWSIAECSLLRRSNRQEKNQKKTRRRQWIIAWSDSLWKSWNVLTPQMWNRSIAATQNKCICSLLLLPFVPHFSIQNRAASCKSTRLYMLIFWRRLTAGLDCFG